MIVPSSIVVLTGAGVSAESGVDTFRDPNGIWSKIDYHDVATPEGFERNPERVHDFYNQRRRGMASLQPNAAHFALARLEREFSGDFLLVTQNIDDLHERAGLQKLVHTHGELAKALCANCGSRHEWHEHLSTLVPCPSCHVAGFMRPDVVWFGEFPYRMDEIYAALGACDLFISIGTSGNVYPAAGFVEEARSVGAHTVELNLEASECHDLFAEVIHSRATEIVPDFVERLLRAT
jgi:NAD-dependent deacetylase